MFEFLGKPRDWPALNVFGREHRWSGILLRNCLAWLENRGLATSHGEGKEVRWVRTGWEPGEIDLDPQEDLPDPLDEAVSLDDLDELGRPLGE